MPELINYLISLYANQLVNNSYPTLAITILVIATGLSVIQDHSLSKWDRLVYTSLDGCQYDK